MHHRQIGLIPGKPSWFIIEKLIRVFYHVNRIKEKNHIILSISVETAFDKIQHEFIENS